MEADRGVGLALGLTGAPRAKTESNGPNVERSPTSKDSVGDDVVEVV